MAFKYLRDVYNDHREAIPLFGKYLPYWTRGTDRVGPLPTMPILSLLERDLVDDSRGTVFFAHLNIPHYPYVFDKECTIISDTDEWLYRFRMEAITPQDNDKKSRADRYGRSLEQIRCLHKKLGRMIDTIRGSGGYDEWTIVIHGDHGSRIGLTNATASNENKLTVADYIDAFSTIFAVKAPGIESGYNSQPASLSDLLGIALFGEAYNASKDDHIFLLAEPAGKMTRKPMQWHD